MYVKVAEPHIGVGPYAECLDFDLEFRLNRQSV